MISHQQIFLQHLAQTSTTPLLLEIASAKGSKLIDVNGKEYIDLIAGIGVSSLGHRHPAVVAAITKQIEKYLHVMVYGEYVQTPQVQLAKAIIETLPSSIDMVFLVNSGSEAIEGAMKLSKRYTERYEMVSCVNAYHGSSQGALSLCGNETIKRKFRPLLPGITHVRYGNMEDLKYISEKTAAFFIETVQGEAGVRIASSDYFQEVRKRCDMTGTLLVMDEIQCGFGRTGKFWAFEHYNIIPDIVVSAKAMGGGMPIGCFMANKEITMSLASNPALGHITTFGGHPVAAAAALATIKAIKQENIMLDVSKKEQLFRQYLKHPCIKNMRTFGLMMAMELDSNTFLKAVINKSLELGVISDWFLFDDRSIRISPPLTISEDEIFFACQNIIHAIHHTESMNK